MTLVEFVLARLADVEALAEAAMDLEWHLDGGDVMSVPQVNSIAWVGDRHENGQHIAVHDPARVLRRVAADRQIVALGCCDEPGHGWESTAELELVIRLLALPYDDHPDYDPQWRPE
jgi:hypothetical protein